jgi:hypothetical protein
VERPLWITVGALIAGQVPDDQRLITGAGQEHVGVFERGRKGCDPARMALKRTLENELFRHFAGSFGRCSIDLRRRVWKFFKISRNILPVVGCLSDTLKYFSAQL